MTAREPANGSSGRQRATHLDIEPLVFSVLLGKTTLRRMYKTGPGTFGRNRDIKDPNQGPERQPDGFKVTSKHAGVLM